MAGRHIPERTCVACRTQQPKRAMVRIVRTGPGSVRVDETGKTAGRGAYLCRRASCWTDGLHKQALERALKTNISNGDRTSLEVYAVGLAVDPARDAPGVAEGSNT